MDSRSFFSVANENYPLLRPAQAPPPKKTLMAGFSLLVGDMQLATQNYLANESAMRDWARSHVVRVPENPTGSIVSSTT